MGRDGDTCLIGSENSVERCRLGSRQNRKKGISKKIASLWSWMAKTNRMQRAKRN